MQILVQAKPSEHDFYYTEERKPLDGPTIQKIDKSLHMFRSTQILIF